MKYAVVLALLGTASAIRDAPPYFNEGTWNERYQSAAGLVQTGFAEGAKGTEDLSEYMQAKPSHYAQRGSINNEHIDPWVYEFSSDAISGLNKPRSSAAPAKAPAANVQRTDIGRQRVDPYVYDEVREAVSPIPNRRPATPTASFVMLNDIAEDGVGQSVYHEVSKEIDALPGGGRAANPPSLLMTDPIGQEGLGDVVYEQAEKEVGVFTMPRASTPPPMLATTSDIAHEGVGEGVWEEVHSNILPIPERRIGDPSLVMTSAEPEKVHVLEPIAYQNRANTNKPNIRTTFYDKKNGLWRSDVGKQI